MYVLTLPLNSQSASKKCIFLMLYLADCGAKPLACHIPTSMPSVAALLQDCITIIC